MKNRVDNEKDYSKKIELIKSPLFNFIRSKIYNHSDAEDILQNTLLILIEKQNSYNSNKSFYSWAFTICKFQIKRYLTLSKRNREDNWESFESAPLINTSSPFCDLAQKEYIKQKDYAISQIKSKFLTPRELEFFSLIQKGKNREEIMDSMGIKIINYYQYRNRVSKRFVKNYAEV